MQNAFFYDVPEGAKVIPIVPIVTNNFAAWLQEQNDRIKNWLNTYDFSAKDSTFCLVLDSEGNLEQVLLGIKSAEILVIRSFASRAKKWLL